MACDLIAVLKSCELILCVVCLVYRIWTEWEMLQVFYKLEKQSREWPLATNFVRDRRNAIFSEVTLGAYVIICTGLLIGHVAGELNNARVTEGFFLVLGTLLFLIVGGISLATVDDVPHQLVDNGIILGVLTILAAILFLLDIGLTRKQAGHPDAKTKKPQTKPPLKQIASAPKPPEKGPTASEEKVDEVDQSKKKKKGVLTELRSSLKKRNAEDIGGRGVVVEKTVDFQERERNQNGQQQAAPAESPPQVGRRHMENRGFTQQKRYSEEDTISRRSLEADDFERSFVKVERRSNGYIKGDERQSAVTARDDERSYSRNQDPEPFTRMPDRQSERYGRQDSRHHDYDRGDLPKANGYIKRESSREDDRQPNGYYRQDDRHPEYARPMKERRHSFDYIQKEDRSGEPFGYDDRFKRNDESRRSQIVRTDDSPRNYRRRDDEYRDFEFDDLRKPVYVGDRSSYRGYSDTVKYLERQTSDRPIKDDRHDAPDSAMPPKHVIEVEMDDHFYRPASANDVRRSNNTRRLDDRDVTLQVAKVTSSQKHEANGSSDDSELIPQIPSVSFLLSERGRKVMPSLSASPVERVSTPKYYFADPSSPGYVKQQASNWPSPSPVDSKAQSSRSAP